jgi:hypothetical protein
MLETLKNLIVTKIMFTSVISCPRWLLVLVRNRENLVSCERDIRR